MSSARRIVAVLLVVGVLAALAVASRGREPAAPTVAAGDVERASASMPVAAPAGALSSTYYCAGGGADGGALDATVVIANPTDRTVTSTVTVFPAAVEGDAAAAAAVAALRPVASTAPVPAHARIEVRLGAVQASPFAAALVEVDSGLVAVERRVTGSSGTSTGPCASSTSSSWHLPTGVTTVDARELIAVFNPFPDDAVADIAFVTSDGFRAPPSVQGFVLPSRQVAVLDVGKLAGRHEQVATRVIARRGRVVVDRLQSFDGTAPGRPASVAATLGAPAASPVWTFPQGSVTDGLTETYAIFNPGNQSATVDLEIALDDPATNGVADPIPVTVPAVGYALVAMADQPRVPKGIGHSVVARVRAGPDVVAERVLVGATGAKRVGYGPALGSPLVATTWVFADGRADATTAAWLTVYNPSPTAVARIDVAELAQGQSVAIDGMQRLEVAPGGRLDVELGAHVNRPALSLVVTADRPVVAERGLFAASGPGLSLALGIPLPHGLARADRAPAPTTTTTSPPPPAAPSTAPLPAPSTASGDASTTSPSTTATTVPTTTSTTVPTTTTAAPAPN